MSSESSEEMATSVAETVTSDNVAITSTSAPINNVNVDASFNVSMTNNVTEEATPTEEELDELLARQQAEMQELAKKQRIAAKQAQLPRLRADCDKLRLQQQPPPSQQVTRSRAVTFAPSMVSDQTVAAMGHLNLGNNTTVNQVMGGQPVMSYTLNNQTLRQDQDLQRLVDSSMDRLGLNDNQVPSRNRDNSPGSTTLSASSSDSTSSSSDNERSRRKKSKKSKKKRRSRSSSRSRSGSGRHKSGKSRKLTHYVPYPQRWPHTYLSQQYVGKEKKYEDLSIAEFGAGYCTILERTEVASERLARTALLKELMYFSTVYRWSSVLDYHAACLLEIERGHSKWGDGFHHLVHTTLVPMGRSEKRGDRRNDLKQKKDKPKGVSTGLIRFCSAWQKGECTQSGDHDGTIKGQSFLLRHICANCWLAEKKCVPHPESQCTEKDQSS